MFKRLILSLPIFIAIFIAGCAPPLPTEEVIIEVATATPEPRVNLDCGSDAEKSFEDYESWTKVNSAPLISEGHAKRGKAGYVDIYVDDLAASTYLAASAPFAECARIVKVKYKDETFTGIAGMTVMVKMPAGYDPEHNDWWYAIYNAVGTIAIEEGLLYSDCIACHMQVSDTDYLFSKEVLAEE